MPTAPQVLPLSASFASPEPPDVICLSHLRWDFVFQRPQHLLTRCARKHRVFYVEEVRIEDGPPRIEMARNQDGVSVVTPYLPDWPESSSAQGVPGARTRALLDEWLRRHEMSEFVLWYYTPMAVSFTRHLAPIATVYDCMDELSAFSGAPALLRAYENELLARADLVLTGGQSLYERKRHLHHNVHAFPSSVDVRHFARARSWRRDPVDQAAIGGPRLGFFGVIDERMDLDLIAGVAAARPHWQLVLIGPCAKIDSAALPHGSNIHYLGPKPYAQLPEYLAGWDVALIPFARNEATKYISPTKTPEYLAAGRPVVSTSITDVIRPYGQQGLARIADSVPAFVEAIEQALAEDAAERLRAADAFLSHTSWDGTWNRISALLDAVIDGKQSGAARTGTTGGSD